MKSSIQIMSLLMVLGLSGCDFFKGPTESNSNPDSYTAEFELIEEIPTLTACEGERSIPYKVKKCFKNGSETDNLSCNHLSKIPLIVKSPQGSLSVDIEGENESIVGEKTYQCEEGESLSEEKVTVECSDSRYNPYSLGNNSIDNTCKPYPIEISDGVYGEIMTDSIGDIYQIQVEYSNDPKISSIKKVNFPKVKIGTGGSGGICGFKDNIVWCEQRNSGGLLVLNINEVPELSRNIRIEKIIHHYNLLCALYEDHEVACTQAPRFQGSQGTNRIYGGTGRGSESNTGPDGTNNDLIFAQGPIIEEYSGAIDIVGSQDLSCALFEDDSIKCSGRLGNLSIDSENTNVNTPVDAVNRSRSMNGQSGFDLSLCPFPRVSTYSCFQYGHTSIGNENILYSTGNVYGYWLAITNQGKVYQYNNESNNFSLFHSELIEKINSKGSLFILNKKIYFNSNNPKKIQIY